jgi:dTDP-4-amino-4,6-dideoxygalactose transaminase
MQKKTTPDFIPISRPWLDKDDAEAASAAVLSGWVTQGPRVEEFEQRFAAYTGAKYAVALSSCTTALHCALISARVGLGHEVICPSLSFIATANAIRYTGATPVFAEIDPSTYNIDIHAAANLITPKTRAILIVHQMGMPADIDAFSDLCRKHGLVLIEDAACAAGSVYKGKKIGFHSDLVCFSFHPRKIITTGDGGMVTTSNPDIAAGIKRMRHHGMSVSDMVRHHSKQVITEEYPEIGYNYRMTDIQAAVGIVQLGKLDRMIERYRSVAAKYTTMLGNNRFLATPFEPEDCVSNFQSYCVYIKPECTVPRDIVMQRMLDKGIATRRGIMTIHREKAYTDVFGKKSLPVSEDSSDRSFLLPIFYYMRDDEVERVVFELLAAIG